jgi:hypothetical protein
MSAKEMQRTQINLCEPCVNPCEPCGKKNI